ncbi:MAG: metalloregulator ArsR/SmtB family transcription factor [Anaerobutyricum sp.]|nr:metalloregulator ArsR/SmtB family transcription factor [Eubacterium sp.]MDY6047310.1 metalloregulator ArsR/SmtB family transcription factor [Anaerobutyricum sp.]
MATKKSDCTPMFLESIEQVKKNMPKDQDVDQVVAFYKVLGDKTRLRILYALKEQEMCAGDIAVLLDMTKSAVSHQLAVMRNMHQIKSRREGKNVFYSLDDEHIVDILEEALVHMVHHQLEYPESDSQ